MPQKCDHLQKYGHAAFSDSWKLSGGLAEYCHLLRGTAIMRVPEGIPEQVVCPANCATATVAAIYRTAEEVLGPDFGPVLILGAGMLGVTASAMAMVKGATHVIVCDVDAGRLECAKNFGATECVLVEEGADTLRRTVQTLTKGRGVDCVVEVSGASSAIGEGLALARTGGCIVLAGSVFPAPPLPIEAERIVRGLLTIRGVHNYRPDDLVAALGFLEAHHDRFPFRSLVSRTFPLDQVQTAFAYAAASSAHRVCVRPGR